MIYCVVPPELAPELHEPLRRFYGDDPAVEVIVERRAREAPTSRRRGRERRLAFVSVSPRPVPAEAAPHSKRLLFVERVEPAERRAEDRDTARLVGRFQAGEPAAFDDLYLRYYDRAYAYLCVALGDSHEAEDATQQVFLKALEGLPDYEQRGKPFSAWLFVIVRNCAIDQLRRHGRADPEEPRSVDRRRERIAAMRPEQVADRGVLALVEQLPPLQRRVLVLRYVLDLSNAEIARILDRSEVSVRQSQHVALGALRSRLGDR